MASSCRTISAKEFHMSSTDQTSQKKRPAGNDIMREKEDQQEHPSRRSRQELATTDTNNFMPTGKRQKFLRLHLQILRALYNDDHPPPLGEKKKEGPKQEKKQEKMPEDGKVDHDEKMQEKDGKVDDEKPPAVVEKADDKTTRPEDGNVEDGLWDMIQTFLKDRQELRVMADEVESYRGVHDEALRFMEEQREEMANSMPPPPVEEDIPSMIFSSSRATYASSSQQQLSPFAGVRFSGAPSFLSGTQINMDPMSQGGVGAFGLIAGLLKRKYCLAEDELKEKTKPFLPLVDTVGQRIATLEALMTGGREDEFPVEEKEGMTANTSKSTKKKAVGFVSDTPDEELMARMETKLRLWKLLLLDLSRSSG